MMTIVFGKDINVFPIIFQIYLECSLWLLVYFANIQI